jgi:hypothetical protein
VHRYLEVKTREREETAAGRWRCGWVRLWTKMGDQRLMGGFSPANNWAG